MKLSQNRKPPESAAPSPLPASPTDLLSASEPQTLPAVLANAFTRLRLGQRVRVLRRLLLPVGPMALAVLGGGAFAKYAAQARWPRISISFDDAARVTSGQIYELVRYVQQSNPVVLQQLLAVLARDATAMAAIGASVAAIVLKRQADRKTEQRPGPALPATAGMQPAD
jgi:hypothetical protein